MKLTSILLLVILIGCTRHANNEALTRAIDSLTKEVALLRLELQKNDTVRPKNDDAILLKDTTIQAKPIIPKRDSVKQKPVKEVRIKKEPENDTVIYKFSDGRLSVKIHPWQNDKQLIEVYSPQGEVIYTFENVWLSYQISNTLHFRSDGSLDKVKSHMNPGASLYWYESVTQFETDNQPSWMITYQYPQMSALDALGEKYLWNRTEKRWVKQEYIQETSTPGN